MGDSPTMSSVEVAGSGLLKMMPYRNEQKQRWGCRHSAAWWGSYLSNFLEACLVRRDPRFLPRTLHPHLLQQGNSHLLPLSCCLGNQDAGRQAGTWPACELRNGLWSQVINQAWSLLPEPGLTPQRHLRRHCWSRREGPGQGHENESCAGVRRLGLGPSAAL